MADHDVSDLISIDHDVARAVERVERWRSSLPEDPFASADDDPFEGVRRVSSKSTHDALLERPTGSSEIALRDALVRWTGVLVDTRVGLSDEAALAVETNARRARFEGEPPRLVSWREAWRALAAARSAGEARLWLDTAAHVGPPVADARRRHAERRTEVARRLGDRHPWSLLLPAAPAAIRSAAECVLDATEEIAASLRKEAPQAASGAGAILFAAVARDAGEGWPARVSADWLDRTFGAFVRGVPIRIQDLPVTLGASSFARALYGFGFAARVASAPASLPFSLAHEPSSLGAHRLGFVLGSLAADTDFQTRILDVGRRTAAAQAGLLARTALLDVRLHAARVLLDPVDDPPPEAFERVTSRLFGSPLDARLRGAWPPARTDEPARLVALVQAPDLRASLIDRFDIDWYRNPRAWLHLRAEASGPSREAIDDASLAPAARALGRAFEQALG